jgi:ferric-dicitrate binding protein FerR (iron transport regulator)
MESKIHQYLEGKLAEEEQQELLLWIRQADNQLYFESVKEIWWKDKLNKTDPKTRDFSELRLGERLKEKRQYELNYRFLKIYKYAAIILLMISLSVILFYTRSQINKPDLMATEIYTVYGQVSGMTLPDGSKVWINSGTKLSFNNRFNQDNREIKVQGEAFFSVPRNKKIPLIVDLGALKVKVTGTQFGVSNYEDSEIMRIVLEEGSVNIQSPNDHLIAKLVPNEMALFNKSKNTIEKLSVNPEYYTSWRNGIIHIYEMPLKEVVRKLEKRYNQKFEVDPAIRDIPFTFSIENESLPEILGLLKKTASIKAVQKGDTINLE